MMKLPKTRGFQSLENKPAVINVGVLNKHFVDGATVSPKIIGEKNLVKSVAHGVKILGEGELKVALKVKDCAFSKSAEEKIKKAGGEIVA
jgi:large subunit ribosomal protein L15